MVKYGNKLLTQKVQSNQVCCLYYIIIFRIDSRINDEQALSNEFENAQIQQELIRLSDEYYSGYLLKKQAEDKVEGTTEKVAEIEYEPIDLITTKVVDCREIGAEFPDFGANRKKKILNHKGWSESNIKNALISIQCQ